MGVSLSTAERAQVRDLLELLAPRAADPPLELPSLPITYLRVARWLGTPPVSPRTPYAAALFEIDAQPEHLPRVLEGLDPAIAAAVLENAVFIADTNAPMLADELARRKLVPPPRLAALLARTDLERCLALLERLDRTPDARVPYVESTAAAYLATYAAGVVPAQLAAVWRELDARRAPASWAPALAGARLEIAAAEEPAHAFDRLVSTLEEHGAVELGRAPMRVVAAAVRFDREGVVGLAEYGWPAHRAIMAHGLAFAEPTAPELPPIVDEILASWLRDPDVDRTPRGTIELALPLLATTILMRDDERASATVTATQPSRFMLNAATWAPMRRVNLADGHWRPALWDQLVALTRHSDEPAVPRLGDADYAAWWKLCSLPIEELPWFDAWSAP